MAKVALHDGGNTPQGPPRMGESVGTGSLAQEVEELVVSRSGALRLTAGMPFGGGARCTVAVERLTPATDGTG